MNDSQLRLSRRVDFLEEKDDTFHIQRCCTDLGQLPCEFGPVFRSVTNLRRFTVVVAEYNVCQANSHITVSCAFENIERSSCSREDIVVCRNFPLQNANPQKPSFACDGLPGIFLRREGVAFQS